jgi:hypothetical protein
VHLQIYITTTHFAHFLEPDATAITEVTVHNSRLNVTLTYTAGVTTFVALNALDLIVTSDMVTDVQAGLVLRVLQHGSGPYYLALIIAGIPTAVTGKCGAMCVIWLLLSNIPMCHLCRCKMFWYSHNSHHR